MPKASGMRGTAGSAFWDERNGGGDHISVSHFSNLRKPSRNWHGAAGLNWNKNECVFSETDGRTGSPSSIRATATGNVERRVLPDGIRDLTSGGESQEFLVERPRVHEIIPMKGADDD
jgi:hypothetical protein